VLFKTIVEFCLNKTQWNIQHNIFFKGKESLGYKNKIYKLNNSFYCSITQFSILKANPIFSQTKFSIFPKVKNLFTQRANFLKRKYFKKFSTILFQNNFWA